MKFKVEAKTHLSKVIRYLTYVRNSITSELKQLQFPFRHELKTLLCMFQSRKRLRNREVVKALIYFLVLYLKVTWTFLKRERTKFSGVFCGWALLKVTLVQWVPFLLWLLHFQNICVVIFCFVEILGKLCLQSVCYTQNTTNAL